MAGKRFYDDGCLTAHAMDLIGERWAMLVIRELLFGPKRFTDLKGSLPGISPNVLSQRLEELEGFGLISRRQLPPPAPSRLYELTQWGRALQPAMAALGAWAARSPHLPLEKPMGAAALVLALETLIDPERARWQSFTIGLKLGPQDFSASVTRRQLSVLPQPAERPDAVLAGAPDAVASVILRGTALDEALAGGDVSFDGSRRVLEDFVTLFQRPGQA